MTWYAVYRKANGVLHSIGTVLAVPMPDEFTAKPLPTRPDLSLVQWNTTKLDFVPIPPPLPDLVQEAVVGFADLDMSTMTQAQIIALIVRALKFLVKRELSRG